MISNSVTKIGHNAFSDCRALTSIKVAEDNPKYDSRGGCNAIIETESNKLLFGCQSTVIPDSVAEIGGGTFSNCCALTSIEIPTSVTEIGELAFKSCGLTSVVIPDSVTKIGDDAFSDCCALTSVVISNSVTKIGHNAFSDCRALTSIKVAEDNPKYDSRGGCNAIIETESNKLLFGCQSTVIPDSVAEIGRCAFSNCCALTSIEIPTSVTEIGDFAFFGCTGLTSVVIPSSVTEIGDHAFFGCTGLTNGEIHSPEIEFGIRVLSECENLKSIKVPAKKADYYKKRLPEELHDLIVEMEPKKKTKKK